MAASAMRAFTFLAALLTAFASVRCGGLGGEPPQRPPAVKGPDGKERYVTQHRSYKATYDRWGRLERIDHDSDGDGRPDRILRHDGAKSPRRVEIDSDLDGHVDRWEDFTPEGALHRWTTVERGRPQMWTVVANDAKTPLRYEYDRDADGRVERSEVVVDGRIGRVELDTDRDGRFDRWQEWDGGKMRSEAMDTDADGKPDRRLTYGGDGRIAGVEPLGP